MLLCFSSIIGVFMYIFLHQQNKHEEKMRKKKETENNIIEKSKI